VRYGLSLVFGIVIIFLVLGHVPAYAVDITAEMSSKGISEKPVFRFVETSFVDYHDGGKIKDTLFGKNVTISLVENSSNPSVKNIIDRINAHLSQDLKSSTRITDMLVDYHASLLGQDNSATIDYSLTLIPVISNYVVAKYSDDSTVVDVQWIGMSLSEPAVISTAKYGDIDIGTLEGFMQKVAPSLDIADLHAQQLLNRDLIDSSSLIQQPVSNWQRLFDPAYIITETSGWGYNGSKIAITTFTVGESRIGVTQNTVTKTADFVMDKNYEIQTIQHASSATIQIDGQANIAMSGGQMIFTTTPQAVGNNPLPSTGLSVQMIYSMAGFGAAIAIGIFVWSNKKMKESLKREKENIPHTTFQYEERRHWADRFDEQKDILGKKKTTRSAI
jgi:hypothetical protein